MFIFCILVFTLSNTITGQENYALLNRAADLFQKEKLQIKNYKVHQEVFSKIKEPTATVIEKRIQVGYFLNPDQYTFITKEIEINGIKQILTKPIIERTSKLEVDWLSKEGLSSHSFQTLSSDSKMVKYLVSPLKIQAGYYRGQLWISQQNAKIIKILKEPIIKKKEMMKYNLELSFEGEQGYQAPSRTFLSAVYQSNNRNTDIEVEAIFKDYRFNLDLNQELPK